MIAGVTGGGFLMGRSIHPANLNVLFLLVVVVSALQWGRRPALFAALTSVAVFDFCFIPPYFTFAPTDLSYLVTLFGFIVVAIITSELASRSRDLVVAQAARTRAEALTHAKDSILDKISHELRSPLASVLGWVQTLRQAPDDAARVGRGLDAIESSARLLARLVDDLLSASRMHAGKLPIQLQPTLIGPAVTRAVVAARVLAQRKGITLESSIEDVPSTLADEQRIEQIVTNLLSNAIKFTPPPGRVTVRLSAAQGVTRLVVEDTGVGIPADFLPQVFEPFTQADTRDARGGLGLGLSIVKTLVQAHGGTISVVSPGRNRGATFTIEIPTAQTIGGDSAEIGAFQVQHGLPESRSIH